MRTALRCSARLSVASHAILRSPVWTRAVYQTVKDVSPGFSRLASTAFKSRQPRGPLKKHQSSDVKTPESYVAFYDKFLPADLRSGNALQSKFNSRTLLDIKSRAKREIEVDLWVWMAQNGYRKQLVWLLNTALNQFASQPKNRESMPSNIDWPDTMFDDLHYSEEPLPEISVKQSEKVELDTLLDDRSKASRSERSFMLTLWPTLAKLVLAAGDSESEAAHSSMRTVLLVLATMHNLDMIPKDVYSYKPLNLSSNGKRPPILHLCSSRILASLSDATWREHQDEAIAQATRLGHSLKHISENAPGGRFRLKVQPLPIELWLELILWCCVDSGNRATAYDIINMLHHSEEPWFAVRWCSTQTSPLAETLVDWNRVKLRHGGVVGRIEGYSRERPFADVPEKTVSVEVVLALIESFITSGPSSSSFKKISDLLHFLEPHDLPPTYFDYLQSRLLLAGFHDKATDPNQLQEWSQQFTAMRTLKPIKEISRAVQTLELDSVLDHNLMQIGVMHQVLDALILRSAVHNALEIFNNIQEQVDRNKFQSIAEFVQKETHSYRLEYVDSHGQIPYHQLAAFLDLASEAKMLGLGEWLLYSDDPDDALIPPTAYTLTSLAPSLARYASANGDDVLLTRIQAQFADKYVSLRAKPTVRALRALFDAGVESLDFASVTKNLAALKTRGARIGLTNYAYLGAAILRIENGYTSDQFSPNLASLPLAADFLDRILSAEYHRPTSKEILVNRMEYRQQVSHILRLFAHCEGSILQNLARKHAPKYASGNRIMLYTRVFDVLLSGIVDAYGVKRGREVYELFCKQAGYDAFGFQFESDDEDPTEDSTSSKPIETGENGRTHTSEEFVESYFAKQDDLEILHETDPFLRPMPIAFPQASTLRVILRAALTQNDRYLATNIEQWAITQFPLVGIMSADSIAQEIQRPLTDIDVKKITSFKYRLDATHSTRVQDSRQTVDVEARARETDKLKKAAERSLWAKLIPSFDSH